MRFPSLSLPFFQIGKPQKIKLQLRIKFSKKKKDTVHPIVFLSDVVFCLIQANEESKDPVKIYRLLHHALAVPFLTRASM